MLNTQYCFLLLQVIESSELYQDNGVLQNDMGCFEL